MVKLNYKLSFRAKSADVAEEYNFNLSYIPRFRYATLGMTT